MNKLLVLKLLVLIHFGYSELLKNVTEFRKKAGDLLEPPNDKESIPDLESLKECLEVGAAFGIDLPEIGRLKLVSTTKFIASKKLSIFFFF